jgi:cell wall-associated NlpC family hydrolase
MTNIQLFIEAALNEVGCPYVWGGKGTHLFDINKGLVNSPYFNVERERDRVHVFDCSGLVTWAMLRATGKDKRGQWNAQLMADGLERLHGPDFPKFPHLKFYGKAPDRITHVAIALGAIDGKFVVVEASGGDQSTRTLLDAEQQGAKVRVGFERRLDFQCITKLPVE